MTTHSGTAPSPTLAQTCAKNDDKDAWNLARQGEWDELMDVVKRAVDAVAEVAPCVSLVFEADRREGSRTARRPIWRSWNATLPDFSGTGGGELVARLLDGGAHMCEVQILVAGH
jgi:hypothetical protein